MGRTPTNLKFESDRTVVVERGRRAQDSDSRLVVVFTAIQVRRFWKHKALPVRD